MTPRKTFSVFVVFALVNVALSADGRIGSAGANDCECPENYLPVCGADGQGSILQNSVSAEKLSSSNWGQISSPKPACTRVARFFLTQYTKIYQSTTKLPKDHKMYQLAVEIFQMIIKYTNIFHSKVLQNLPNLGNLV
jgi:hypothetical protein